jgi:hypothetical protein
MKTRARALTGLTPAMTMLVIACGGSSNSETDGGLGDAGTQPAAFVAASLRSAVGAPDCQAAAAWMNIGTATPGTPTTSANGSTIGDATVNVQCTVQGNPAGYRVLLIAGLADASGNVNALMTVGYQMPVPVVTPSGGAAITASFRGMGAYDATDCSFTFSYRGQAISPASALGAGRIWGHLSCPMAAPQGQPQSACDAEVDLLFENCTQ